jgi:hypothetical protein
MAPPLVPFLAPLVPFVKGGFGLAYKGLVAYSYANLLDMLTGNRIGNFISNRIFGRQTGQQNQDNLGLNKRLLNLKETGTPTKGGALRFLGGGGGSDDAPDIVPTNQSVLDSIAMNQGLALGNTMVPEIDGTSSDQSGFAGLREEIDKINQNIQAIATAMLASSKIESSYRQELLDDLERSLVNKDKVRSRGRTERSIKNTILNQRDAFVDKTGSLAGNVANALALSLGLEAANSILKDSEKKDKKEEQEKGEEVDNEVIPTGIDTSEVDDIQLFPEIPFYDEGKNEAIKNLDSTESTLDSFTNIGRSNIDALFDLFNFNQSSKEEKQNLLNIDQQSGSNTNSEIDINQNSIDKSTDLSQNINVNSNDVAFSPVESMSGMTQIIDLRTARQVSGSTNDTAKTKLDTNIANLDPERRTSPYEVLVRSV